MGKKDDSSYNKIEFPQETDHAEKDYIVVVGETKFTNVFETMEPPPTLKQRLKNFPIEKPITFVFLVFMMVSYTTYEVNPAYFVRLSKTKYGKKVVDAYKTNVEPTVAKIFKSAAPVGASTTEDEKIRDVANAKISEWSIYVESDPEGAEIYINELPTRLITPSQIDLKQESNFELKVIDKNLPPFKVILDTRKHKITIDLKDGTYEAQ